MKREQVTEGAQGGADSGMPGTLFVVATPIGNLEDITLRALRVLREADLIAAEDTRATRKLLARYDIHTKLVSYYQGRECEKEESLVATLKGGGSVALVSEAGTPCISDPGFRLVRRAVEEGLRVEPIPGASAAIAALSAAGLPTDRFTFVGFLGDKPGKRRKALEELRAVSNTLVFYLSKWKAHAHLRDCLEILGDRRACLCRELTKIHEEFRRGALSELLASVEEKSLKGEIVLLVEGDRKETAP